MPADDSWQVRRARGRKIYAGLSRRQVLGAYQRGRLRDDDLALPPGADCWMPLAVALQQYQEAAAGAKRDRPANEQLAQPQPAETHLPDWVPMHQEGRLRPGPPDEEQEDPAEMEMMPMIDITTLLLIFFLVGGVFMLQARVALPEAKTGTPETTVEQKPVAVVIKPDKDQPDQSDISFEDQPDQPVGIEQLAAGYRERLLDPGFTPEVVIKAHRGIHFGLVRQVMATLTDAGVQQIRVAVEEPRQ